MPLTYVSTRGDAAELGFADVLLAGLATDGGLYCPTEIPPLPTITADMPYPEAATAILAPYVAGSFDEVELGAIVEEAYGVFGHPDVCPVVELEDGQYLLDLTRGPTLAFKDIALQVVARLLDAELARRQERVTVLGATSGDTGSAAINALAGRENIEVVILHPHDRVSAVQRRQMTTVTAANVHNLAVAGTFDDCQDLVKGAFADAEFRAEVGLAAVNSINWARVMCQIVYFVTAARAVRPNGEPVSFSVPTGNFGNVLSGWYAKRMGLAVDRLVVASNRNDVLTRFFETGTLETRTVEPSLSPSMDIQISSNFERLLWEASGRDSAAVAELMVELRSAGRVTVPDSWYRTVLDEFDGERLDDAGTVAEVASTYAATSCLVDPHTAVGLEAARRSPAATPMITLATADPAKFPDAVESAVGFHPELPAHLHDLFELPERFDKIDNDQAEVAAAIRKIRR